MDILNNQPIHTHLIANTDFLEALSNNFEEDEIVEILKYAKDVTLDYPMIMDKFYDWFEEEFNNYPSDINIISIGWESYGWGPGGSGFISFDLVFGLVRMSSSDYEEDYTEIFDKENFSPWAIESLDNDSVEISSDIYTNSELLELAEDLGLGEDTELTIEGIQSDQAS